MQKKETRSQFCRTGNIPFDSTQTFLLKSAVNSVLYASLPKCLMSDREKKQKKKTNRYASKRNDVLRNVISIARVIDQTPANADNRYRRATVSASDIHPRRMRLAAILYFFPSVSEITISFFRCRNAEAVTSSAGHGNEYLRELVRRGAKCSHLARCNNAILKKGVRTSRHLYSSQRARKQKKRRAGGETAARDSRLAGMSVASVRPLINLPLRRRGGNKKPPGRRTLSQ